MKILIELPTWLGDTVMSTPAIENILRHYPEAKITLIGSKIATEITHNHPKIIKSIILDKDLILNFDTLMPDGQIRKDVCNKKMRELFPEFEFKSFANGIESVYNSVLNE